MDIVIAASIASNKDQSSEIISWFKTVYSTLSNKANPAALLATDSIAPTVVGAPSYTSGVHI